MEQWCEYIVNPDVDSKNDTTTTRLKIYFIQFFKPKLLKEQQN